MKKFLFLFLFLASTAQAAEPPASYYAPPPQFHAVMQVMDDGYANITALFRNATGSFRFTDTDKSISDLKIAIDATSLLADSDATQRAFAGMLGSFSASEIRIMAPDTAAFKDGKAEIKANVTLHGQSKPVTFEAALNKAGISPHSGSMWSSEGQAIGMTLTGKLKRADFGITDDTSSPVRLGDTITLMLDFEAIRQ